MEKPMRTYMVTLLHEPPCLLAQPLAVYRCRSAYGAIQMFDVNFSSYPVRVALWRIDGFDYDYVTSYVCKNY